MFDKSASLAAFSSTGVTMMKEVREQSEKVEEFKERARSDVDVFFLCSGEKEKKVLLAELDRVGMVFGEETGNLLSPFIMTGFEYRKAVKEEKGIIDSIKRGKVLKGKIPVEEG